MDSYRCEPVAATVHIHATLFAYASPFVANNAALVTGSFACTCILYITAEEQQALDTYSKLVYSQALRILNAAVPLLSCTAGKPRPGAGCGKQWYTVVDSGRQW